MIAAAFAIQGITIEEKPPVEKVVNSESLELYRDVQVDKKNYYISDIDIRIIALNQEINEHKLSDNQSFFLDKSISKLDEIISKERDLLIDENVEVPNSRSISNTIQILEQLAANSIFPNRITTSIEEGICLVFQNVLQTMHLEVYNDGDFGYIVENSVEKEIIANEDLESIVNISTVVDRFYN